MKTIAITIDEPTLSKLDALTKGKERARSALIRKAVQQFVASEDARLAEERDAAAYRKHSRLVRRQAEALVAAQASPPRDR
ncbi:MAG: ribbon-helix-helix protein, CopG family [Deltaproteobacteria bacterium]|nr:ribbon-helix-helix protein, CopG family [Deltaproteobacteria bacterium]